MTTVSFSFSFIAATSRRARSSGDAPRSSHGFARAAGADADAGACAEGVAEGVVADATEQGGGALAGVAAEQPHANAAAASAFEPRLIDFTIAPSVAEVGAG